MEIMYEYNKKYYSFKINDKEYTDKQIVGFFKNSLKKKLSISLNDYLSYKGFQIEKCRICYIGDIPISIDFKIIDGELSITNFKYNKKLYCYGNNKECSGIRMNSNSFEFISKVNRISIEEAKLYIKRNNKSPFYKENWASDVDYKNSQSRSIEYYMKKYGEEIGKDKYQNHINNISISNSEEGYINKYGEEGYKKFKEISINKDSMSLKFFIDKNNGDYNKAIFEYEERKKSVNVSLQSLINKYGEENGKSFHNERIKKSKLTLLSNPNYKEICKSKGITLSKMINKYGEKLGIDKYYKWKIDISVPICRSSKESLKIFNPLIDELIKNYNIEYSDIYIGKDNSNEFFLRDGNEIFFYDFTIRSKKIIIEYNGVTFHPKNENSKWTNPFNNEDAKTAFEKQKRKIELAEKNGFKVLELWSDETDNVEKCLKFLNIIG